IRLLSQKTLTPTHLDEAQKNIIRFLDEFKELYVQHKAYRMHYIWQCMHMLWHIAPEIYCLGPPGIYAQWTIEWTIGNLGQEI
ncbi:hypothetical protein P691DRAFT_688618, partial [Macrolepiota fuliginosa MF-IS2]